MWISVLRPRRKGDAEAVVVVVFVSVSVVFDRFHQKFDLLLLLGGTARRMAGGGTPKATTTTTGRGGYPALLAVTDETLLMDVTTYR